MSLNSKDIAFNRFGYGRVFNQPDQEPSDPSEWLISQLKPINLDSQLTGSYASAINLSNSKEIIYQLGKFRQLTRRQQQSSSKSKKQNKKISKDQSNMMAEGSPQDKIKQSRRMLTKNAYGLQAHTLNNAITSNNGFQARLLDFFSNHFSVSATNINMRALAPTLEREAIAPYLSGYFANMLIAVEQHPAMLIYLNNVQSIGPRSTIGKRRGKGLNENLSREILELHTLGVNGGYTQNDVRELAMAITGWSVNYEGINNKTQSQRDAASDSFHFRDAAHEPGVRKILGKKYKQRNALQGVRILQDLAVHPSTANYMSHKIARHFIADDPDPDLVNAMSNAWLKTNGHIKSVLTVMIKHPASWSVNAEKYKTPRDFLISCVRACGSTKMADKQLLQSLKIMGQAPFNAGSPAGYDDTAETWNGPEALISRIEWVNKLSQAVNKSAIDIGETVIAESLTKQSRKIIQRAESRQQAIALLLLSPEFLHR